VCQANCTLQELTHPIPRASMTSGEPDEAADVPAHPVFPRLPARGDHRSVVPAELAAVAADDRDPDVEVSRAPQGRPDRESGRHRARDPRHRQARRPARAAEAPRRPPGTGKTLLARAVAGEADVPFFTLSGSEFVEMFVGVGAARVRDLFEQAKDKAPCIIFIDELDAIGKSRAGATGFVGGHDEREQTLNQLLAEMDGFDSSKGVIIMAATNRPEVLDLALLRPGRFDRQVVVDKPDIRGREAILRLHARNVVLGPSVDLGVLAARTPGFAGADLANIVNEAALLAARKEQDAVGMADFEEAIDRVVAGLEKKSRVLSDKERDIVAHHEMGHALVATSLPHADPVHKV